MAARADLMDIDLDRITTALAGLSPTRPLTIKAIVESQLSHIEDARARGLTHIEIATALTQTGCPITAATLRKYLSQFQQKSAARFPARLSKTPNTHTCKQVETPTSTSKRSLRRSAFLSSESKA